MPPAPGCPGRAGDRARPAHPPAARARAVDPRARPHPGSDRLLTDGRLELIDVGAAGRLDPGEQAAIRDLMAGVSRKDADMVANAVLQVGHLRRGVDVNDFERALAHGLPPRSRCTYWR
mgnify:CR=1 FL=1